MHISIVGIGKTGLPLAIALTQRGHQVLAIEKSPSRVQQLQDPSWAPIDEPFCDWASRQSIHFTTSYADAGTTDLTVLIVETPESTRGVMDTDAIASAAQQLRDVLDDTRPHPLVVSSTVLPGTCRYVLQPIMGNHPVVLNPVWIALGNVVQDYLNPPVCVVGFDAPRSGAHTVVGAVPPIVDEFAYRTFLKTKRMVVDTASAELLKMVHNAWCTTKMDFANAMGELFHDIGSDPNILTHFMKSGGERVGTFLRSGEPWGGPCFPRDLRFLLTVARDVNDAGLAKWVLEGVQERNEARIATIALHIPRTPPKTVVVAGIGYKPGSHVTTESPGILVAHQLAALGHSVLVHDPVARTEEFPMAMLEHLQGADYIVEMHPNLVRDTRVKVIHPWALEV